MRAPAFLLLAAAAHADYISSKVFSSCAPGEPALFELAEYPAPCNAFGGESSSLRCSSDGNNVSLVGFNTFGCSGPVTAQLPYPFTPDCSDTSGKPSERSTCVRGAYAEPEDRVNFAMYLNPGTDCVGPPTILESIPAEACLDFAGASGSVLLTCKEPGLEGMVVEKLFEGAACAGAAANVTVHQPGCRSERPGEEGGAATAALLAAAPRRAAALHRARRAQQQQQPSGAASESATASRTPSHTPVPPAAASASSTPSRTPAPPAPPAPGHQSYSVWKCPTA